MGGDNGAAFWGTGGSRVQISALRPDKSATYLTLGDAAPIAKLPGVTSGVTADRIQRLPRFKRLMYKEPVAKPE
jgi:hypothetical protein